jgi:D-alanine--poly(phosphoribitol) ligase subunit 2
VSTQHTQLDARAIASAIKEKIIEIASGLGADARSVGEDEIIPATGLLDSAGIFELIAWYDIRYEMSLKEEEITISNLGSIEKMADYVVKRKSLT